MRLAREIDDVLPGVRELRTAPPPGGPPWVPSWDDVAQRLEGVYRSLLP